MNKTPVRKKRNPQATRDAILQAACEVFVEKGCEGTSVSEIASRAGITKSLIHHYYGSKEALYLEFIRLYFQRFAAKLATRLKGAVTGDSFLTEGFTAYFRFLKETPEYVRLGCWVNLFYQKNPGMLKQAEQLPPSQDEKVAFVNSVSRTIIDAIRNAQRSGMIRADIEAEDILAALWCLTEHWHEAKGLMGLRLKSDTSGPAADDRYAEASLKILLKGILS